MCTAMATWNEFRLGDPAMAASATQLWHDIVALDDGAHDAELPRPFEFAIAYLASVRADGAPRVHPCCPVLADGRLHLAIPAPSPKGDDLRRDGRYALHALPGIDDAELC